MIRKMSIGDTLIETIRGHPTKWIVESHTGGKGMLLYCGSKGFRTVTVRTLCNSKVWDHTNKDKRK